MQSLNKVYFVAETTKKTSKKTEKSKKSEKFGQDKRILYKNRAFFILIRIT